MRAYSLDLRQKVVAAVGRGDSTIEEVAATFGVGLTSPIEQCWSKIKPSLGAAKARRRAELEQALARAIGQITKSDIRGWFKHCGYKVASG